MRAISCLTWILISTLPALAQSPPEKKDADRDAKAAIEAIRKALRDLPPGEEADQIRKSLERLEKRVADVKGRIAALESDVALWRERVAWAERMATKGFISRTQLDADRARLGQAEMELERLKKPSTPNPEKN